MKETSVLAQVSVPAPKTSYFMDKIFPPLLMAAFTAGFGLIAMYFAVGTLSNRVTAIEDSRSDIVPRFIVTEEQTKQTREDIKEMKETIEKVSDKQDRLLEYFNIQESN